MHEKKMDSDVTTALLKTLGLEDAGAEAPAPVRSDPEFVIASPSFDWAPGDSPDDDTYSTQRTLAAIMKLSTGELH